MCVSEPPARLALLVAACQADPDQCWALCNQILSETIGYTQAATCQVKHYPTVHEAVIGYDADTGDYEAGCPVPGRRPPGLGRFRGASARGPAAAWLSSAAWLEAASVHAFVALARDLSAHGAPAALRRAAVRAAHEEACHAAAVGALAAAAGAAPAPVDVPPPRRRSLVAMAIENATEGCVGETWAALIAHWQAQHAADPAARAVLAAIADDETGHAELAWATNRWAERRLDARGRARVAAARRRAVARLEANVGRAVPAGEVVHRLGVPDRGAARRLFAEARARLWA